MCVCMELRQAPQRHRMRKDREWERKTERDREGERESDSSTR